LETPFFFSRYPRRDKWCACAPFVFEVVVREGKSETRHQVTMSQEMCERLTAGKHTPERCLEAAFRFLLDREPKESILGRFDVTVISRYFPEFERGDATLHFAALINAETLSKDAPLQRSVSVGDYYCNPILPAFASSLGAAVIFRKAKINTDEVSGTHRRLIPSFATSQGQPAASANRHPPH
jgi:hypothetical protein